MNIPFLCVFISFVFIMLPKIAISVAMAREQGGYDNHHPRDQQSGLKGWARRAQAAHQNSFEAFAPFAAAVILCHLTNGDSRWASVLSVSFIGARIIYPVLYIADVSTLRSLVWSIGYGCTAGLFVVALWG